MRYLNLYLNKEFEKDDSDYYIDRISDTLSGHGEVDLTIHVSTKGGDIFEAFRFAYYLFMMKDKLNITIISYTEVMSAGILFCLIAPANKKVVTPLTIGIIHKTDSDFSIKELAKSGYNFTKFQNEVYERDNENFENIYRLVGVDDYKINKVKQGEEAFFTARELQELFDNSMEHCLISKVY